LNKIKRLPSNQKLLKHQFIKPKKKEFVRC